MAVRPYPYERLPHVSRRDADWLRSAARALPDAAARRRATAEAASMLGAQVAGELGPIELWSQADARAELAGTACALWLERAHGARGLPVLCELPPELGAALVDRVLGGDGAVAHAPGVALDELSSGVLAYVAARVCAALGAELRVRSLLDGAERMLALLDEPVLVLPIGMRCGDGLNGRLRVLVRAGDARALHGARAPSADEHQATRVAPFLRALPVTICAHAGTAVLAQRDVQGLGAGDVVVVDGCALLRGAHGFGGAIELRVLGGRRGRLRASAHESVITIEAWERTGDAAMTDGKRIETEALRNDVTTLAGDAPIELCLELARFSLPLEELSALRAGEVLTTRHPIGEQVALTAGGRTIARGELVEIDGEVGVRIVELVR